MNLDELQSIRDRERQSDSLQQLREDFYVDVGEFVQKLREERNAVAKRADDPFDAPEVNRLTDDINTAEQTVEAIYERRVGKLVKMASFAAADMPTEDEGLTAEERELFERMVAAIEGNRETVMSVIDGDEPPATDSATDLQEQTEPSDTSPDRAPSEARDPPAGETDASADTGGVDAADLMAGSESTPGDQSEPTRPPAADDAPPEPPSADADPIDGSPGDDSEPTDTAPGEGDPEPTDTKGTEAPPAEGEPVPPDLRDEQAAETRAAPAEPSSPDPSSDTVAGDGSGEDTPARAANGGGAGEEGTRADREGGSRAVDRETVRITADVGQIFGVDEREYELAREDVVTLPSENAAPLVERDVAERLDRTGN